MCQDSAWVSSRSGAALFLVVNQNALWMQNSLGAVLWVQQAHKRLFAGTSSRCRSADAFLHGTSSSRLPSISARIAPKLQTSTAGPYSLAPYNSSGDRYLQVYATKCALCVQHGGPGACSTVSLVHAQQWPGARNNVPGACSTVRRTRCAWCAEHGAPGALKKTRMACKTRCT